MEGAGTAVLVLCWEPALSTRGSRHGPVQVREEKLFQDSQGQMGCTCPEKEQVSVREVKGFDLEQGQESFGEMVTSKLRSQRSGDPLAEPQRPCVLAAFWVWDKMPEAVSFQDERCGSRFPRFQSLVTRPHHFEPMAVQSIMSGEHSRGDHPMMARKQNKNEKEELGEPVFSAGPYFPLLCPTSLGSTIPKRLVTKAFGDILPLAPRLIPSHSTKCM